MPSETSPENPKAVPTQDVVESQLTEELAGTRFACRSLTALSGGTANFIFRGTLQTPLEDGTNEVVVKHGEAYGASTGTLSLPTTRCVSFCCPGCVPPPRSRNSQKGASRFSRRSASGWPRT